MPTDKKGTELILSNDSAQYCVGERVADTAMYRVYLCEEVETGQQRLLQIADKVQHNGELDRAAFILKRLKSTADEFERVHAKQGGTKLLSYERLFPNLVDSFIAEDQGRRRVNIVAIAEVEDPSTLVPLSHLRDRDRLRVSLTSSAWIMGRLLKLLGLAHGEGIAVHTLGGNNVLLEPSRHFAVVFDWSSALTHDGEIPSRLCKDDLQAAAKTVLLAIGEDLESGVYDHSSDRAERPYLEYLWHLANRREGDANKAHDQFYKLVDELWGREFRPFQTLPL